MKQKLSFLFAFLGWAAIILQFYLMMENRVESELETTIRFFSFFTILTNTLVAVFFTIQAFNSNTVKALTPLTIYITIVGLVYQILLRHTWNPTGLQKIVDELLHSVIPVLTIIYWYLYEEKSKLKYSHIRGWVVFPLLYLAYILLRGHYSGFYPYPFVNVTALGMTRVLINSAFILAAFLLISVTFTWIGRLKAR